VAGLLDALRGAGATGQVSTLLDRDPAGHVSLGDPWAVARLLGVLDEVGATDQVTALANRAAAHTSLDNLLAVSQLLGALRASGAQAQAAKLMERLPATDMFEHFYRQEGHREKFRFGWEADGRPAERWAWTDLG
jgi:hypothetical protein